MLKWCPRHAGSLVGSRTRKRDCRYGCYPHLAFPGYRVVPPRAGGASLLAAARRWWPMRAHMRHAIDFGVCARRTVALALLSYGARHAVCADGARRLASGGALWRPLASSVRAWQLAAVATGVAPSPRVARRIDRRDRGRAVSNCPIWRRASDSDSALSERET